MGLDTRVPCRCWINGLTSDPPFDLSLLEYKEDELSVRDSDDRSIEEVIRMDVAMDTWLEKCCPHPYMEYCSEWVGSWSMVNTFSGYVDQFDDGRLGFLRDMMPEGNYGQVEPSDAQRGIEELEILRTLIEGQTAFFLYDSDTGQELCHYIPAHTGPIRTGSDFSCGFDPDGIFVRAGKYDDMFHASMAGQTPSKATIGELFRSMRISQRAIDERDGRPVVQWIGDNGANFVGIGLGIGDGYHQIEVTSRALVWADVPCVEPLSNLFRAAIQIDMPIYWL